MEAVGRLVMLHEIEVGRSITMNDIFEKRSGPLPSCRMVDAVDRCRIPAVVAGSFTSSSYRSPACVV